MATTIIGDQIVIVVRLSKILIIELDIRLCYRNVKTDTVYLKSCQCPIQTDQFAWQVMYITNDMVVISAI